MISKDIDFWLQLAARKSSLPNESSEGWEEWVTEPVITHNLVPTQARATLEVVGMLASKRRSVPEMLGLLLAIASLDDNNVGVSGAEAGKSLRKILKII